jgi:DnaJ-class molecular chaperone
MSDEIECPDCDGEGRIWNNCDPTSGQSVDCDACNGKGWREPTQDEADNMAEDAYQRQFEGEPPMSFAERTEMQAKRDADWGVK